MLKGTVYALAAKHVVFAVGANERFDALKQNWDRAHTHTAMHITDTCGNGHINPPPQNHNQC